MSHRHITLFDRVRFCILALMRAVLRLRSRPLDWKSIGSRVVIFAPHADDESLGAGGFIALRSELKLTTEVIVVTDGNSSLSHDPFSASLRLAGLRRNEAIRAAGSLGLPLESLTFLGIPEGTLCALPRASYLTLREAVVNHLRRIHPDAVLMPHYDDGHPEHAATYELVKSACGEFPGLAVYSFPIWSAWSPALLARHLVNRRRIFRIRRGGAHTEAKLAALLAYDAQFNTVPPWPRPVLPRGFIPLFTESDEYFFAD